MIDLIRSVCLPSRCGWCVNTPPSRWDRLWRFDQRMLWAERTPLERLIMRIEWAADRVPIWKLARRWHFAHHRRVSL